MIPNSQAYLRLRTQSQEFLDFVVLSCTAIPTLVHRLKTSGVQGVTPDHFKGSPNLTQLQSFAQIYQGPLARSTVLTLWSLFEAYVKSLLVEIIDFHGGEERFQATAERRARTFVAKSSPGIVASTRKLQEPAKGARKGSYQKHSKKLVDLGYRFPSELLAPYGAKILIAAKVDHHATEHFFVLEAFA